MARKSEGSLRAGPISIFTLVIVLCITVLGVLAASTVHASLAATGKQAMYTEDTYKNETAAWEFVQKVDDALLPVREAGGGLDAAESAVAAVLPSNAVMTGPEVEAEFSTDSGRTLTVALDITEDGKLAIQKWAASTIRKNFETEDTLWTGM